MSSFTPKTRDRRTFIGGSDARIIMGEDEAALLRLSREKRGEIEPEDLSDNLVVQLGSVTEDLNRHWYEEAQPSYFCLEVSRPRRRTPGPPPFSSMNSTPAASSARRRAASLGSVTGISPSTTSTRRIVATPTFEALARSRALQRSSARAARNCALEILLVGVDVLSDMM